MKVVVLALTGSRRRGVVHDTNFLLSRGAEVILVTMQEQPWREFALPLDPRVRVLELRAGEGRHPLPRVERVIVFRGPRFLFRILKAAVRLASRSSVATAVAAPVGAGVLAAERGYEKVASAFHNRVFIRFYRLVRPALLAGIAERGVLAEVDFGEVGEVLVTDTHAVPLGWRLAREHPDLRVAFALDPERYPEIAGAA